MQKEELMLKKRLIELSKIAYQKEIVTYSDYLNLNELNILHTIPKTEFHTTFVTFGGYEFSERQMAAFLPDALCYDYDYPIAVLKVHPLYPKYAESLSHRDYLGAILNLGVDRSKVGDILVEDKSAILFVHKSLKSFITEELCRIKHTCITIETENAKDFTYKPKIKEIQGTVSSVRLDSLLALAFPFSRSKLVSYIEGGKVFVNGKLTTSNAYQLKGNDIISVRGLGKFQYKAVVSQTKKGRYFITIHLYT